MQQHEYLRKTKLLAVNWIEENRVLTIGNRSVMKAKMIIRNDILGKETAKFYNALQNSSVHW